MSARRRRRLAERVLLYALVLLVAAFYGVPLLWMVSTSVKLPQEIFTAPPTFVPSRVTLANYRSRTDR